MGCQIHRLAGKPRSYRSREHHGIPVAAAEQREAAIGTAGAAKPGTAFLQANRMRRFCEDFVLERSLALLGSGYRHA